MLASFIRKLFLCHAVVIAVGATYAHSETLNLPRSSQKARVMQQVGLTQITINYSRPLVKGRKIWGGLEPYGKVWRAGADENTTIEFTDSVSIEGKPLAKGIYGVHMIPDQDEWTVIFSKNATSWGSYTYDQAEDALRVKVKPKPSELHEALTYEFEDPTADSSTIAFKWEKVTVPIKLQVNTNEFAQQSIKNQLRGAPKWTWQGWDEAANYLIAQKIALADALKYADESIQLEERFDNLMTKATALEAVNRKDEAIAIRKKAIGIGTVLQLHSYGRQLQSKGQQTQAFEIFRTNMKKAPNHWLVHSEVARLACAESKFDNAVKEMKIAAASAPTQYKPMMESLVQRLEAKQDINK